MMIIEPKLSDMFSDHVPLPINKAGILKKECKRIRQN